jgi:parvulin-like peptidyl-prolyl isomerase
MKKVIMFLVAAIASMSFSMAYAGGHDMAGMGKNECMLASEQCQRASQSIQEKLATLRAEIAKGTKVYSVEELNKLNQKLKEVEQTLEQMLRNP